MTSQTSRDSDSYSAIHLGDGAYATVCPDGTIEISANHHLPEQASATVYIPAEARRTLAEFLLLEER